MQLQTQNTQLTEVENDIDEEEDNYRDKHRSALPDLGGKNQPQSQFEMQGIKTNEDNEWDSPGGGKEVKAKSLLPSLQGRNRQVEVQNVDGTLSD